VPWSLSVHRVPPSNDVVVSGWRTEDDDFLPLVPRGARADPSQQVVEHALADRFPGDRSRGPKSWQPVFDKITRFELEKGVFLTSG